MSLQPLRVGIAGATGYVGAELLRMLRRHPAVKVVAVASSGSGGTALRARLPAHTPGGDVPSQFCTLEVDNFSACDAVFCALPHGVGAGFIAQLVRAGRTVFDLSADFRLKDPAVYAQWYGTHPAPELLAQAHYALPEWFTTPTRSEPAPESAGGPSGGPTAPQLFALPGCYPTASVLALAPLFKQGWIAPGPLVVQGFSGTSGAGRQAKDSLHFCAVAEGFRAYGPAGTHRHTPEIEATLAALSGREVTLSFQPHLLPMTRGLAVTATAPASEAFQALPDPASAVAAAYEAAYAAHPLVRVLERGVLPDTLWVRGSAGAVVAAHFDARTGQLFAYAALDNLLKGAAAQALQVMNLHFGWPEVLGLDVEAAWP